MYWLLFLSNLTVCFFLLPWIGFNTSNYKHIKVNSLLKYILYLLLFAIVFSLINNFNSDYFYQLFLPSRKEGLIQSGYQKLFLVSLPAILLVFAYVRDGNVRLTALLGLLILFITGQRRIIINFLLLALTLWIFIRNNSKIQIRRFVLIGTLLVLLIPGLWYARSYTTQIQNNRSEIINPLSTRSPLELIWGSSSSGFETMCYLEAFEDNIDFLPLHSFQYISASFIPRSVLPDKPLSITMQIKEDMGLAGNPSIFFTNEMLLNGGVLGVILAFFVGGMLRVLIDLWGWKFEIFALANVITLFKNGFSYFITEVIFVFLLLLFFSFLSNVIHRKL